MALIKLATTADLKPNTMKVVNANGKPILLVNLDGAFYAIGNVCTHMGCPLSRGVLNGDTVYAPATAPYSTSKQERSSEVSRRSPSRNTS